MIPNNAFTDPAVVTDFLPPIDGAYSRLRSTVMGGIALNDPSQGRMYQQWVAYYESGNINVKIKDSHTIAFSLPATDVYTVSLAFDNNMGIVLAWIDTSNNANLYYFDTLSSSYITRVFDDNTYGYTSCRVCVDNAHDYYITNSDVIFAYIDFEGFLNYRQQRDRYDIEYRVGGPVNGTLTKVGPTVGNRLQFAVQVIYNPGLA